MGAIIAGSIREHEDLQDEIDVLFASNKDLGLLSFVVFLVNSLRCQNEKCEWQDDTMPEESFAAIASANAADWDTVNDITALPVVTAEITKLKIGDVILLPFGGEVCIVTTIDVSGQTIGLQKRGWGGTTATVQGEAALEIFIIGNAQVDGSDPMAASFKAPTEVYNYVQIFEDTAEVSGKVMRSRITRDSEMSRQLGMKLKRLFSQLNFALLNGVREKTGDRATMQGMRNRTTLTTNIGGALAVGGIYTMITTMIDAGAFPGGLHGSPTAIAEVEQLFPTFVTSSVSDWHGKLTVKKLSILGQEIEIHVDKHMVDSELLLIDYDRVTYGTQNSGEATGAFSAYEVNKNGKQWEKHIVGYYTMKQKQAAASVNRAYGITYS